MTFERFEMSGFEVRRDTIAAPDNYPSKGTGELGTFFYDSEGNLIGIAQPVREGATRSIGVPRECDTAGSAWRPSGSRRESAQAHLRSAVRHGAAIPGKATVASKGAASAKQPRANTTPHCCLRVDPTVRPRSAAS